MSTTVDCNLRWISHQDIKAVLNIEKQSFPDAWGRSELISHLCMRHHAGIVADVGGVVVGYILFEFNQSVSELLRIAVSVPDRRIGVGTKLMEKLFGLILKKGGAEMQVRVRESNLIGQLFFRSVGFRAILPVEKGFFDTEEDAYVMRFIGSSLSKSL